MLIFKYMLHLLKEFGKGILGCLFFLICSSIFLAIIGLISYGLGSVIKLTFPNIPNSEGDMVTLALGYVTCMGIAAIWIVTYNTIVETKKSWRRFKMKYHIKENK